MAGKILRLENFIPYQLSFTTNLVSDAIATAYESLFGLKIPEWRVIAVLGEDGPSTQQAIAGKTRMDKVTVSRAAIALCERDLIARAPNADDRRSHRLELTRSGRELYARVVPQALALEEKIFSHFSATELKNFSAMLRRINQILLSED